MMLIRSRILKSRINGRRDARDEFKQKYGKELGVQKKQSRWE
jgi:hypothetical protein